MKYYGVTVKGWTIQNHLSFLEPLLYRLCTATQFKYAISIYNPTYQHPIYRAYVLTSIISDSLLQVGCSCEKVIFTEINKLFGFPWRTKQLNLTLNSFPTVSVQICVDPILIIYDHKALYNYIDDFYSTRETQI